MLQILAPHALLGFAATSTHSRAHSKAECRRATAYYGKAPRLFASAYAEILHNPSLSVYNSMATPSPCCISKSTLEIVYRIEFLTSC